MYGTIGLSNIKTLYPLFCLPTSTFTIDCSSLYPLFLSSTSTSAINCLLSTVETRSLSLSSFTIICFSFMHLIPCSYSYPRHTYYWGRIKWRVLGSKLHFEIVQGSTQFLSLCSLCTLSTIYIYSIYPFHLYLTCSSHL